MFWGKRKKVDHGGNPQYLPGEEPAPWPPGSYNDKLRFQRHIATVTSGFHDDDVQPFHLAYAFKSQPDVGGALNYAYDLYGLPLNNVCGPWMVAENPTRPLGAAPVAFFHMAPVTSIGGLIPGQVISQPLLGPDNPGSGYDIYS
jgi:hypothetical protein